MKPYIRHIKKIGLFLSLLSILPFLSWAQGTASWELAKNSIFIGDQISLKWSTKIDPQWTQLQLPQLGDSFAKIEILQKGKIDTIINKDYILYQQDLLITCFDSGTYFMPALSIQAKDKNGNPIQVNLPDNIALHVQTIDVDTSKPFMPIVEIMDEAAPDFPTKAKEWIQEHKMAVIIAGISFLLILLAFLLWLFYFKNKKRKEKTIPELPFVKAKRRVAELESSGLWEDQDYKAYYSQLSQIIRDYFEDQFQVNAGEMTTRDLLHTIKRNPHLRGIHQELRQILQTADLSKFAKALPTEEDHLESVKFAYKIIEQTQPSPTTTNDQ